MPDVDPIMERLEDQIVWFDKRSVSNQRSYKRTKVFVIVAAATIPFLTALAVPPGYETKMKWIIGILGVLITAFEGVIQLYKFNENWIRYRATSEALKSEKYLYLAQAGPYAMAKNAHALLAERVEAVISQENQKWVTALQEQKQEGEEQQKGQDQQPPGEDQQKQ
jgi:hypothetical protein